MTVINWLYQLDVSLLLWINHTLQNPVFDFVMPVLTDLHKIKALQIGIILFWLSLYKFNRRGFFVGLALIVTLMISDFVGGQLKNFFMRPRPDMAGINVILRSLHFSGGSFPSNHALNMFCLYQFISFYFARLRPYLFILATLVAFSRIYCGVHYPSDVLGGVYLGSFLGILCSKLMYPLISKTG